MKAVYRVRFKLTTKKDRRSDATFILVAPGFSFIFRKTLFGFASSAISFMYLLILLSMDVEACKYSSPMGGYEINSEEPS